MKRIWLAFLLSALGLLVLASPSLASAQGDSGCWNTVAHVWYPTGAVVPSGSHCLGGNLWELNGIVFSGGPWPLPAQEVAAGSGGQPIPNDPQIVDLANRVMELERQRVNQDAVNQELQRQITDLNTQITNLTAQLQGEEAVATPRLMEAFRKAPATFAVIGTLLLLAAIIGGYLLVEVYRRRRNRPARVLPPIDNRRPDGPVVDELPTNPWRRDGDRPAAPAVVVDADPIS